MKPSIKINVIPNQNILPHQSDDVSTITPLTPYSPVTPIYTFSADSKAKNSFKDTLKQAGFNPLQRIANALQGSVWRVSASESKTDTVTYIVKIANKKLHNKSIAYINDKQIKISENIENEAAIIKYLNANQPPITLINYHKFFSDAYNYFLVLEDGGDSLFSFVKESHEHIKNDTIDIKEWHKFCKGAITQMVNVLHWMHDNNCCHLDVSLENFVISNIKTTVLCDANNTRKMIFSQGFQIRIIDFGLSELFGSKAKKNQVDFKSRKYCGKTQYMAPEVYAKRNAFDARSSDCWSLGVCMFIIIQQDIYHIQFVGNPPFVEPSVNDTLFDYIIHGQIMDVLYAWNVSHYINDEILNLLLAIFQDEKHRLNIQEIQQHCWLNN
eukprot:88320_1